jgi:hypothetical protein
MAFDGSADTKACVERTTDAARVAAVFNHPEVRPWAGKPDAGPLDFSDFLANLDNVALATDHACFLFKRDEPGRYELHTGIVPEGRGAAVIPAASAAFRWMFVHTDCVELVTQIAGSNRPADLMARRAGFKPIFTRKGGAEDGSDLTGFVLSLAFWPSLDPTLAEEGHALHVALEAAKEAAGSTAPVHPDDDAHDRAVGLSCLMAKAGNTAKAVWAYNRWARLAGYRQAQILPPPPPVLDIGDAHIRFTPELEILRCPPQQ